VASQTDDIGESTITLATDGSAGERPFYARLGAVLLLAGLGYLLKPVRQEKLVRSIQRAARVTGARLLRVAEQSQLGRRRQQVCARLGDQLRLIAVDDIYYFSAGQKYVTLRHRGGSDLIDESLRALADEFAPDFVRIHRNSLVATRYVGAVERSTEGQYLVRVKECGDLLPVSRRHAVEALRHIRGGH
jgi:two-component system response regulator AlgR